MDLHLTSAFSEFGAQRIPLITEPAPIDHRDAIDIGKLKEVLQTTRHHAAVVLGTLSEPAPSHAGIHCPLDAFAAGSLPATWLVDNWNGQVDAFVRAYDEQGVLWVVSSTFLADLLDPRPLLAALKRVCLARNGTVLFVYGEASGNFRHWSPEAFTAFLAAGGFPLRPHNAAGAAWMIATLTLESYAGYLEGLGLDPQLATSDWLLLSTEDAGLARTGGIGTYTRNIKTLDARVAVLMADAQAQPADLDARTLAPMALANVSHEDFHLGIHTIEVLRNALYLLPHIALVEAQDYQSILFRIVQAKRTGLLPSWLHLRVFMHGAIDYLKHGFSDDAAMNYTPFEASLAIRDSYIFKYADSCYAPSKYLGHDLMREEFGYEVANQRIVRLPFDLSLLPSDRPTRFKPVTRIAFIGKYMQLKGWPDFVQALEILGSQGKLEQIEEIVSLAPSSPSPEDAEKIANAAAYRAMHLSHQELLDFVDRHREDTLFVVPSRGESFSYVVLEQLLLGARFVAYNRGGVVEVVDDADYVSQFFCDPTATALADRIEEVLRLCPADHQAAVEETRNRIRERQHDVNVWWSRRDAPALQPEWPRSVVLPSPEVTIVACVCNTPLAHLEDLVRSIRRSRLKPVEVLLIDGGSDGMYMQALEAWTQNTARADTKISLRMEPSGNAGGARDTGLKLTRSEFAFFLAGDVVLLPGTLEDSWNALAIDEGLVAATGFAITSTNPASVLGSDKAPHPNDFRKLLGIPEARALALTENQYLDSNAMVRTDALREAGGWDDADSATWDAWAFYTKLAWGGMRFSLIPAPGYLDRDVAESVPTATSKFLKRRRLAHSLIGISRLDASILLSLVDRENGDDRPQPMTPAAEPPSPPPLAEPTITVQEEVENMESLLSRPAHSWIRRCASKSFRVIGRIRRFLIKT